MIPREEFNLAAESVRANITVAFPEMIAYKSSIQLEVLKIANPHEIEDVRDGRINQELMDKLCRLAKDLWDAKGDVTSLYCAAMAVATIVKEYGWGTQYLIGDGMWTLAQQIQNA